MLVMHKLAAVVLSLTVCVAQDHQGQKASGPQGPKPELGTVTWRTIASKADFTKSLAVAKKSQRPAFLLFQEIPGCDTCTGFGKNVLSHPLIKEAIETQFVPIVVRNNVKGAEDDIRKHFKEPSWNNPVVRFVNHNGDDILPRKDGVWDAHGIAVRMVATLIADKRPVPGFLEIAAAETAPKTDKAVFEMHCYWEGEAHLGAIDGVIKTTSAWVGKAEVVEVVFRPEVISKAKLTEAAQAKSCKPVSAKKVRVAKASDQQHSLGGTAYAKLNLTPMQRTKIHADLSNKRDAVRWLSPSQAKALAKAKARPHKD